jgi:hypothetical protein
MVLVWKEPSSVSLHLMVARLLENSSEAQETLMLCSLAERDLADALLIVRASSRWLL